MAPLPTLIPLLKRILRPLLPNNRTLRTPSMTTSSNRTHSFTLVGPIRIVCRSLDHRAIVALTAFVAHTKALLEMHRGSILPWTHHIRFHSGLLGLSPFAARVCGAVAFSEGVAVIGFFGLDVTAMVEVVQIRRKYASTAAVAGLLRAVRNVLGLGALLRRCFVLCRCPTGMMNGLVMLLMLEVSSIQPTPPGYRSGCGLISGYAPVGMVLSHCFARKWVMEERLGERAGRLSFYAGRNGCPGGDMSLMMIVRRTRYI